ncbi:inorganic pyrophosphatase [Lactobacillus helveticus]|uniref:hypothetical protein n=1 Tax=Lactobacillus helveticus TaxID=1587 RepID=UPI001C64A6AD|nr:hypothetical protein [Lactobacillus helveticus]MBW7986528.1 inorganic pyrophosphatase [Lactobacillus helveticus]MBW8038268.1 inorganic pyrophosphatase [Lactobacillus helveticus]
MLEDNVRFWQLLDHLINDSKIVIDRPKGSRHPRFHETVYPLDYGYLNRTTSSDDEAIDVFIGSNAVKKLTAVIITVDIMKKDSEIKLLLGCSKEEEKTALDFCNRTDNMQGILVSRKYK